MQSCPTITKLYQAYKNVGKDFLLSSHIRDILFYLKMLIINILDSERGMYLFCKDIHFYSFCISTFWGKKKCSNLYKYTRFVLENVSRIIFLGVK